MSEGTSSAVELLLSDLRRSMEVGLTKIDGQLALVLQRQLQGEQHTAENTADIEKLQTQMSDVRREAVTHADLDKRTVRIIGILGLIVAAVGTTATVAAMFIPH